MKNLLCNFPNQYRRAAIDIKLFHIDTLEEIIFPAQGINLVMQIIECFRHFSSLEITAQRPKSLFQRIYIIFI